MSGEQISEQIAADKYVELTYSIVDEEGEIVERVNIPVKYIHGRDSGLFPKIETALEGCRPGEEIEVMLEPEEAFGPNLPELRFTDDLANVPPEFQQLGAEVQMKNDREEVKKFIVTKIENGKLTVDGNHPLAGKTLNFEVEVIDVK